MSIEEAAILYIKRLAQKGKSKAYITSVDVEFQIKKI